MKKKKSCLTPWYMNKDGYKWEEDEAWDPLVVFVCEERETDVGEDKVLCDEVDEFKCFLCPPTGLQGEVYVSIVGLHNPTEQNSHDTWSRRTWWKNAVRRGGRNDQVIYKQSRIFVNIFASESSGIRLILSVVLGEESMREYWVWWARGYNGDEK